MNLVQCTRTSALPTHTRQLWIDRLRCNRNDFPFFESIFSFNLHLLRFRAELRSRLMEMQIFQSGFFQLGNFRIMSVGRFSMHNLVSIRLLLSYSCWIKISHENFQLFTFLCCNFLFIGYIIDVDTFKITYTDKHSMGNINIKRYSYQPTLHWTIKCYENKFSDSCKTLL